MILNDEIYGRFEVNDEVLLELIGSRPVQRLKGVSQHGMPVETITEYPHYSRYEHSIGVMLLLRKLGAGLEEQAAGLLHDLSHTAFSHVADWLFGTLSDQSYQDSMLSSYIKNSEVNGILERHGLDPEAIGNMEVNKRYTLLERDAPGLCADRVDYALRDMHALLKVDVRACVDDLAVSNVEIVFKSREQARVFADWYMKCQKMWWKGAEPMLRYNLLADLLNTAIKKGVLTHNQMWGDDSSVLKLLRDSNDPKILKKLDVAVGKLNFEVSENGTIELFGKIRYIDPRFVQDGKVVNLMSVDHDYETMVTLELERMHKKVFVNII